MPSLGLCGSSMHVLLPTDSKLAIGVNVSLNDCLSSCVSPGDLCRINSLSPCDTWDRLQSKRRSHMISKIKASIETKDASRWNRRNLLVSLWHQKIAGVFHQQQNTERHTCRLHLQLSAFHTGHRRCCPYWKLEKRTEQREECEGARTHRVKSY